MGWAPYLLGTPLENAKPNLFEKPVIALFVCIGFKRVIIRLVNEYVRFAVDDLANSNKDMRPIRWSRLNRLPLAIFRFTTHDASP